MPEAVMPNSIEYSSIGGTVYSVPQKAGFGVTGPSQKLRSLDRYVPFSDFGLTWVTCCFQSRDRDFGKAKIGALAL
jgi:hypothetical protein